MRKKIGAFLVIASLIFSLCTAAQASGMTLTLNAPALERTAGETFTVTLTLSDNVGFGSVRLAVSYDAAVAECTELSAGEVLDGVMTAVNPAASDGARLSAASASPVTANGVLAELTFRMKQSGSPNVAVSAFTVSDLSGADLPCEIVGSAAPAENTSGGQSSGGQSSGGQAPVVTPVKKTPFKDVPAGFWCEDWIAQAYDRGLFLGDASGSFHPNDNIKRGDYVLVLWRMAGKPEPRAAAPFKDVPADAYYAKAIAWASENGYVSGTGNDCFTPNGSLTRQAAVKILYGYAGRPAGLYFLFTDTYNAAFTDSASIADWAKDAMYWAYYEGIINGVSASPAALGPGRSTTRAQLAKILVGYQDHQAKEGPQT
ncbi:MAG: S-layer homology domain-containing protein [Oscillibacter sp.]|nr:S-layer homology domain-containing protein [Oscillibacter sp.]